MPKPDWNKKYTAGKGDWRRPEDREKYRKNYDRIFGGPKVRCDKCWYWDWISCWCDYPDHRKAGEAPDVTNPPCGGKLYEEG
jgi:hypothetical protein